MRIMTDAQRRAVCFHEAGHAGILYWRAESLRERRIVIHRSRYGDSLYVPGFDCSESDLMVVIGGPVVELLSEEITAKRAIRFANEYPDPKRDSSRTRRLIRALRHGKDDRTYQFAVQEQVREILQQPPMWRAVTTVAEKLFADWSINGEEVEQILGALAVQNQFGQVHWTDIQAEVRPAA
jgi:hypothetical protein